MAGNPGLPTAIPSRASQASLTCVGLWLLPVVCIFQGSLGALTGTFELKACLRTVCGVLLAVVFVVEWNRCRAKRSSRQSAVVACTAKLHMTKATQKDLRFDSKVRGVCVPSVASRDERNRIFWQDEDFADFSRVRILIGRAYGVVAKRRGVAVDSDFPPEPFLAHESRLGLCLGRKRERLQARKTYITKVLKEQARQLNLNTSTSGDGKHSEECTIADALDHDLLASAAQRASERARACALEEGARLHQRVLINLEETPHQQFARQQTVSILQSPRPEEGPPMRAYRSDGTLRTLKASARGTGTPSEETSEQRILEILSGALNPRAKPKSEETGAFGAPGLPLGAFQASAQGCGISGGSDRSGRSSGAHSGSLLSSTTSAAYPARACGGAALAGTAHDGDCDAA